MTTTRRPLSTDDAAKITLGPQEIADLVLGKISQTLPKVRRATGSTDEDGHIRITTRDFKGRQHATKHNAETKPSAEDPDGIARIHMAYWNTMLIENRKRTAQEWDELEERAR